MAYLDAVLVVADAIALFPIELGDFNFETVSDGAGVEILLVPAIHLSHVMHHVLDTQLRSSSRRTVNPQGLKAARVGPERIHVRQICVMVRVEMADEDVVYQGRRYLHGNRVAYAAVAQIEEESARLRATIAKLDQHGRA